MEENKRLRKIKEEIRKNAIHGANIYKNNLAGKYFVYIFENNYFILNYQIGSFMHLAGLKYSEGAEKFYEKCITEKPSIQINNFRFSSENPIRTARKKMQTSYRVNRFYKKRFISFNKC